MVLATRFSALIFPYEATLAMRTTQNDPCNDGFVGTRTTQRQSSLIRRNDFGPHVRDSSVKPLPNIHKTHPLDKQKNSPPGGRLPPPRFGISEKRMW